MALKTPITLAQWCMKHKILQTMQSIQPERVESTNYNNIQYLGQYTIVQSIYHSPVHPPYSNPSTILRVPRFQIKQSTLITLVKIRPIFKLKRSDIFLISPQKHMLWYSLEVPHRGTSNEYPQHMFHGELRKILCGNPLLSGAMRLT